MKKATALIICLSLAFNILLKVFDFTLWPFRIHDEEKVRQEASRVARSAQALQNSGRRLMTRDNPSPYGLTMGAATVADARRKYPQLAKAISSTISFHGEKVPMNNAYTMHDEDGALITFQFDDHDDTLQNIMLLSSPQPYARLKKTFDAKYPPLKRFTREEFEAYNPFGVDFEHQDRWWARAKPDFAIYKQGDTVILLGINEDRAKGSIIMYRNSSYIPVLKKKLQALKGGRRKPPAEKVI
ncbi:MAG: hypothetical protein Q3966_04340 [Neisseria sp.]|nr:hypothetical protein [Neisseria sp.]